MVKSFFVNEQGIKRILNVMTFDEYIDYHNSNSYKNYCEILILSDGNIILANPGHVYALGAVIKEETGMSLEDLSIQYYEEDLKYYSKCVVVRFEFQSVFSEDFFTIEQQETINKLANYNAINKNVSFYNEDYVNHYLTQKGVL